MIKYIKQILKLVRLRGLEPVNPFAKICPVRLANGHSTKIIKIPFSGFLAFFQGFSLFYVPKTSHTYRDLNPLLQELGRGNFINNKTRIGL